MDFFQSQSVARRATWLLIAGFLMALAAMGLVMHVMVTGLMTAFGGSASLFEPNDKALIMIGIVWTIAILGGFFRWLDVRAGGAALARRFGAEEVIDPGRDEQLQVLLNTVAEMAIASAQPPPRVFHLRREHSINAFVVGSGKVHDERPSLVITDGALHALDRDELRAVVAHEFGHIAQGDLPLNMRLLIAMGGLAALDEVGQLLNGRRPEDLIGHRFHPLMLVGVLLRLFGSIGLGIGGLIRAAVSRKREFLADASAVQYSRDPFALASALAVIRDSQEPDRVGGVHASEIAHLCFQTPVRPAWFRRLFATHPPLQARIDAIDPHVDVKRRKRGAEAPAARAAGPTVAGIDAAPGALAAASLTSGSAAVSSVAESSCGFDNTRDVNKGASSKAPASTTETGARGVGSALDEWHDPAVVSDRIALMLGDSTSCLAALFGLFAPREPIRRRDFLGALAFATDDHLATRTHDVLTSLAAEFEEDRVGLVEHLGVKLTDDLTVEKRQRVLLRVEKLLQAREELDLHAYATLQLVRRKLSVDYPVLAVVAGKTRAGASRVKSFDSMGQEFALLLSLMIESSGAHPDVLDREFSRVLRSYTRADLPRRSCTEPGIVAELERAFQTLYAQPKPIRKAFVEHCVEIMEADGHIARAELTLLELFAASLGCEAKAA